MSAAPSRAVQAHSSSLLFFFSISHFSLCHSFSPPTACPCQNLGSCNTSNNTCSCLNGFIGSSCQDVSDCFAAIGSVYLATGVLTNPCQNDGRCNEASGQCQCTPLFRGSTCATPYSPCTELTPCSNGGTCTDTIAVTRGYTCACPSAYSGTNCTDVVNTCSPQPCLNGGTCSQPGPGEFKCACPQGFTGDRCQTNIDDCVGSPCANGGTCVDGINSFTCTCAVGFSGPTCQSGELWGVAELEWGRWRVC